MFFPRSRRPKASRAHQQSPFSSPYSNIQASPIAARRSSIDERRRTAAKFDLPLSPVNTNRMDEEEQEDDEGENDDQDQYSDSDDAGELSPLLPIFSAAQLGIYVMLFKTCSSSQEAQTLCLSTT